MKWPKLDEAKDTPLIKAVVPTQKSQPQRSLIVLITAIGAGLIGVLLAFAIEANRKAKANPE